MHVYEVRCRDKFGSYEDCTTLARSADEAIRHVLRTLESAFPGREWIAQYAL